MAVNSTMRKVSRQCSSLSPGALLCSLVLPSGRGLLSDDLRNFYHSFHAGPRRAARNAFNVVFRAKVFEGFAAYRPELADGDVVPCLNTLGMGDCLAVELAQATHLGLLRSCGAGRAEHYVRYGAPFPRGPLYELLAIDDRVMIEEFDLQSLGAKNLLDRAAPKVFDRAASAYVRAGLAHQPFLRLQEDLRMEQLGAREGLFRAHLRAGNKLPPISGLIKDPIIPPCIPRC